jgi:hypothetical protein
MATRPQRWKDATSTPFWGVKYTVAVAQVSKWYSTMALSLKVK